MLVEAAPLGGGGGVRGDVVGGDDGPRGRVGPRGSRLTMLEMMERGTTDTSVCAAGLAVSTTVRDAAEFLDVDVDEKTTTAALRVSVSAHEWQHPACCVQSGGYRRTGGVR